MEGRTDIQTDRQTDRPEEERQIGPGGFEKNKVKEKLNIGPQENLEFIFLGEYKILRIADRWSRFKKCCRANAYIIYE